MRSEGTRPPVSQFRSSAERSGQALALIWMSGCRRSVLVFDFRSSVDPFGFDLGPTSGYLACGPQQRGVALGQGWIACPWIITILNSFL